MDTNMVVYALCFLWFVAAISIAAFLLRIPQISIALPVAAFAYFRFMKFMMN
jgi:hypothetical protein